MENSALGVALGAIVGLILALTGAGGGILAVPLLVFGLHLPMARSAPVGLIAVGLSSAFGAALGLRDGIVRYRAAALIGVAGMLLAPVGVRLAKVVPNGPLTVAFAFVLAYVAIRMLRASRRGAQESPPVTAAKAPGTLNPSSGRLIWTMPCGRALAATGVVSGLLSGLLGVVGGFVIVLRSRASRTWKHEASWRPPSQSSRSFRSVELPPPRFRGWLPGTSPCRFPRAPWRRCSLAGASGLA